MGNEKKYYIRMLTKVFTEGINQYWWLDMEKYMRLAAKYDFDATKLQKAIECAEEDEGKTISPKTINRVLGYIYGEKEGKGDKSVTLDTIKALGKALCNGDEYGLLIKIEPSNVFQVLKEIEKYWDNDYELEFDEDNIDDEEFLQAARLFYEQNRARYEAHVKEMQMEAKREQEEKMAITFKELKPYISRTARISICFRDGHYDNYTMISDIEEGRYDDMYVYGIGMADVEFSLDVYKRSPEEFPKRISAKQGYCLSCGLEIVLQDIARDIPRRDEQLLRFRDLRGYLQTGMHFSIVIREDWSAEYYQWRRDIPEAYDDLYVYGIGMEALSKEHIQEIFGNVGHVGMNDTSLMQQMVIVLTKEPRADVE